MLHVVFLLAFLATNAWAFPEMVRHGYVNCMSCHASPTGGGVLTEYGRELSKEALSTWGKDGEQKFLYGAVKNPEWLLFGGDIRSLAFYRDAPTHREGHIIPMQADVEAAIAYKKMLAAATVGLKYNKTPKPVSEYLVSRKHYLGIKPTDEITVRGGRFSPAFGIQVADHAIATKRGLGWDQGSETYNVEASWISERFNHYVTGIFGRPDAPELSREKGAAFSSSVAVFDTYKLGLSYFYGVNSTAKRHVGGPFGILGFTPKFFLLTETDFQRKAPSGKDTEWGLVTYNRLDYEFFQGFHGYLTQELSRLDFSKELTLRKSYGIGIQFFPRPHFELNASYQLIMSAMSSEPTDFLWLMLHYYL